MLSNRWTQSRYSDTIYHLRLKNYRDETRDIVAELESDSSGRVWASVRLGGEQLDLGDMEPYPDYQNAAQAVLKRIQHLFQSRRTGLIMEFQPHQKQEEIKRAYSISIGTAHAWMTGTKSGKPYKISRRCINQVLAHMGFVFGGKGGGVIGIDKPRWEYEENT